MTEKELQQDLIRDVGKKSRGDDLHGMVCMSRLTSDGVTVRKVTSDSPSCILSAFIGVGDCPPSAVDIDTFMSRTLLTK